jgi:ABC-type lipoprotein export system ATPase subunit
MSNINTTLLSWRSVSSRSLGVVHAGEVVAMMGPSGKPSLSCCYPRHALSLSQASLIFSLSLAGSGKTTMLDVLAGRVDRTRKGRSVTGNITITEGTSMRYVTQESSLVGVLSVKETLVRAPEEPPIR